jgi:hypothetical protein
MVVANSLPVDFLLDALMMTLQHSIFLTCIQLNHGYVVDKDLLYYFYYFSGFFRERPFLGGKIRSMVDSR